MPLVLIVCTGNICRSPMAEALLRARLSHDEARQDWQVESAGVWPTDGSPASEYAVEAMARRGIDLRGHLSRHITSEMMAQAALVLTMSQNHAEALGAAFPAYLHKVHLLSEMSGPAYDIRDPYGGTRAEYEHTAQELEQLVDRGYEHIVALVEGTAAARPQAL